MRYADLGHYKEALAAYRQAIDLDPDNRHSYYNMACAYALMGDPRRPATGWQRLSTSIRRFSRRLKTNPTSTRSATTLASRRLWLISPTQRGQSHDH